jgi:ABC-2 type transport system ATP-binding protein
VTVTGPDAARLAELLEADGAAVRRDGDRRLVVTDRSGEQIGRIVAANAIVISELAPASQSLEDIFFELTGAPEEESS